MSDPTPHSHASNPERIPAVEIKNDIKIKATTSNEAASSIIPSSLRSLPLTAVSSLPSSDSLARTVRRQRPTLSLTSSSQLPIELRKTILFRETICACDVFFATFCPCNIVSMQHFVLATICPYNILTITICPQHFVRNDMSATFCLATF
ncbi:unnamed protein product [Didymodactylos carnosus]|uniref:Uncharacterized protein n=2 Tax=Didymodactylos carnosus TaxID=1234261 RepID=A0A816BVS2_9BILA|nr:unnamed protein product [Didymodactylos carnosus]CAF4500671.1 unnamed protein product [Didymodactylos carnosus]